MFFTRSTGMAKPRPIEPDSLESVAIDELMPMTWPCALNSGPPELPGLTAASIWIALVTVASFALSPDVDTGRSTAETMPVVTVLARPSGLPTAMTGSPTTTFEESPSAAALRSSGASLSLITARSVVGSVPTIVASKMRPSVSVTCTSPLASATTWLLVTMLPSSSMMTPEPCEPLPSPVLTSMATTDCWTALATASQFGFSEVEPATGTVSLLDWPIEASEAGREPESSAVIACVSPAVAMAARIAAAAAADVTGSHMLRLRCVGTDPCGGTVPCPAAAAPAWACAGW